jgi:hypothetical protein
MSTVRRELVVALALSTVAFTSTAMAGKGGNKGPNSDAPGIADTSPGQAWQLRKDTEGALSPGQQYKQDRDSLTPALPPGQTFGTPGNRIPGSLP